MSIIKLVAGATTIGYAAQIAVINSLILGSDANVGIGTSAPTARLHTDVGQDSSSCLRLERLTSSSPASGGHTKFLSVDASGNVILGTASGGGRIGVEDALWERTEKGLLRSARNDAVAIGQAVNSAPAGYKLFVEGGILTEKVKVALKNIAEWSDYVFVPGYRLRSLADVEQYIHERGHLPGLPPAQQMVEQGNDLHKTDVKLLEKIEELTLYSIEQQKQIDELKRLVKQLKNRLLLRIKRDYINPVLFVVAIRHLSLESFLRIVTIYKVSYLQNGSEELYSLTCGGIFDISNGKSATTINLKDRRSPARCIKCSSRR